MSRKLEQRALNGHTSCRRMELNGFSKEKFRPKTYASPAPQLGILGHEHRVSIFDVALFHHVVDMCGPIAHDSRGRQK